MGSMAFCISGGKQYRQQRAAFWAGLCICRQHCAVNGINVRKIIRCLLLPQFAVRHFLSGITEKSLNAFYYACTHAKVDYSRFMNVTAAMALKLVPERLKSQPVFLCIDDTMVAKFGKKVEDVSKLFDHAAHNGSNYLNGHCFVSLMLCVPVWRKQRIVYLAVPLGYRMWKKEVSKLKLAASMVRQVMPELSAQRNVIILCDSWYAKKDLVCIMDEYANLDVICNARYDSVIYDLAPQPTGKKGRPAKHGRRLSIETDFTLSEEKVGRQTFVFQHYFPLADGDILCMAGKGAAEPDREQPHAVYSPVVLLFQVEHRGQLL